MSACLNASSYCHAIGLLDICINKQLLANKVANECTVTLRLGTLFS